MTTLPLQIEDIARSLSKIMPKIFTQLGIVTMAINNMTEINSLNVNEAR